MQNQELKQQFEQEQKELKEVDEVIKSIVLDKDKFDVNWRAKSNVQVNKEEFTTELYFLMKKYGIFILEAKRI